MIHFEDYSVQVKAAIDDCCLQWLEESTAEIESQTKAVTPVDTGKLKGSWQHVVDAGAKEAIVGSNEENALWTEFGTGIYSVKGGRKTPWYYVDRHGNGHFTHGKRPQRCLEKSFKSVQGAIVKRFEAILRGLG